MRTPVRKVTHQRKPVGTRHAAWTNAVHKLRTATENAASKAPWRPTCTPDSVGSGILYHLFDLDPGCLHTLEVVTTILAKQSQR
jgi:hypothetical protein